MVFYCSVYYIVVMAWAIHFLGASVHSLWRDDGMLPWATCDNHWNSPGCIAVNANDTTKVVHKEEEETDPGVNASVDVFESIDSALEYWE